MNSIAGDGLVTFSAPELVQLSHVFVHGSGRIFLGSVNVAMAVSAMDDMTGAGLVRFGGAGDGVGQFLNPCGVAVW